MELITMELPPECSTLPATSFTIRPSMSTLTPGQFTPLVMIAPTSSMVPLPIPTSPEQSGFTATIGSESRPGDATGFSNVEGDVVLHINEINDWEQCCSEENVEIYVLDKTEKQSEELTCHKNKVTHLKRPKVTKPKIQKQFICHVCAHESKRQSELVTHLRIHTGEKPYHCHFCDKSFARQDYRNNHIRSHTGEKPFSCPICQRNFSMKVNLNKHLLTHSSYKPYQCEICSARFTRRSQLRLHAHIHSANRAKPCPICRKKLKGSLRKHMKRIHKVENLHEPFHYAKSIAVTENAVDLDTPFSCDHCGEKYASKREMTEHIDFYHYPTSIGTEAEARNEPATTKEKNSQVFGEPKTLNVQPGANNSIDDETIHEVIEASDAIVEKETVVIDSMELPVPVAVDQISEIQPHPYNEENQTYSQLMNYDTRILLARTTQNGTISRAEAESPTADDEDKEQVEYMEEIELVVSPSVMLEVEDVLNKQRRLAHENDCTNFEGVQRSQTVVEELDDANQILEEDETEPLQGGSASCPAWRSSPLPEMKYQCGDCDLQFSRKDGLIIHQRSHTGEKPYQCETCHKHFKDRANYVRHARIHTGERPYKCEKCDAAFVRNAHLKNHLRIHEGKREFQCAECSADFRFYSALVNHKRTHNAQMREFQCKYCPLIFASAKDRGLHMKETHEELSCANCGHSFTSVASLNSHVKAKHSFSVKMGEEATSMSNSTSGLDEILRSVEST